MTLITLNELGWPGETEDMLRKTIELNRRIHPSWAMCSLYHPEPGTAIYQRAEGKKWLTPSSYGVFYDPDVRIDQPWIKQSKLEDYLKNFNKHIYGEVNLLRRERVG